MEDSMDLKDDRDQAWIDSRFQAWKAGFSKKIGVVRKSEKEDHVSRMDTNNNSPGVPSTSACFIAIRVKREIVDDVSVAQDEDKISFPVNNETASASSLWQAALDSVNAGGGLVPPKKSSQLLEYGIAHCEAWMSAVVKYMLENHVALNSNSLKEWASVCYSNTADLMSQFSDLETTTTLPCFKGWFDEFIIGAMATRRREVKRVLDFLENILQAKCQRLDNEFCYEWVSKYKTLQDVCDYLLEDDVNELVTIEAQMGMSSYRLLKCKKAMDYHTSIDHIRAFEAKMAGALTAAVCLPQDLGLEHLNDEIKLEMESERILDQVGRTSELLKGRVVELMDEVRLQLAQENQRLVRREEVVVAEALKYAKDQYAVALEAMMDEPLNGDLTLKKVHGELVKVHSKAYVNVEQFVFTDKWDLDVVRKELDDVYKEVEKKLAARDAEIAKRTAAATTKSTLRTTSQAPRPSFERRSSQSSSLSPHISGLERISSNTSSAFSPPRSSFETTPSSFMKPPAEDTFSDVSDNSYQQGSIRSDVSDIEGSTPRSNTSEPTANITGVAMVVFNNGLVLEGFPKHYAKWDRLFVASTYFKTNQLLRVDHPKTATLNTGQPVRPFNEEILSLQFHRMAKKLQNPENSITKKPLVFAVPTVATSTARCRLKTAATLAGLSTSMFIQTTTAIMVAYAHDYKQVTEKHNAIIYIEDGLIEVALFNVTGGKCLQLATAHVQKPFKLDEIAAPGIIQNAVALLTSVAKSAKLPLSYIEACALTTTLSLVKRHNGLATEHNPLGILIRRGIKDGLTSLGCREDIYFRVRNYQTILVGARMISGEGSDYNRSNLYQEVCPWNIQLSYGNTEAILLAANETRKDVNERIRSKYLLDDTLTISRLDMNDKIFVRGINNCKAVHRDSNAYIQVDVDQQGLITIRPCELWEELLKKDIKCMPLDAEARNRAKKRFAHLYKAFHGAKNGRCGGEKRPSQSPRESGHHKLPRRADRGIGQS